jgi:hypothetical protein
MNAMHTLLLPLSLLRRGRASGLLALWLLASTMAIAQAPGAATDDVATLRNRFQRLAPLLENSPFKRPMTLESTDEAGALQATLDAVLDQPFTKVREVFKSTTQWCGILMLHLYTRHCAVETVSGNAGPATPVIKVAMSRTHDQPLADADRLSFTYQLRIETADALDVRLNADTGPYGTHDYRIALRAIPIEGGRRTFLQLSYGYSYGVAARLAFQAYLATFGHSKVGFSTTGKGPADAPGYIGGTRGLIERNTMRYYLGIEAYFASLSLPPAQQLDKRLIDWFDASEQYARQLHEVDRATYIAAKRSEHQRLLTPGLP